MAVGIADAQHAGRARRMVRRVRGIASTVSKRRVVWPRCAGGAVRRCRRVSRAGIGMANGQRTPQI